MVVCVDQTRDDDPVRQGNSFISIAVLLGNAVVLSDPFDDVSIHVDRGVADVTQFRVSGREQLYVFYKQRFARDGPCLATFDHCRNAMWGRRSARATRRKSPQRRNGLTLVVISACPTALAGEAIVNQSDEPKPPAVVGQRPTCPGRSVFAPLLQVQVVLNLFSKLLVTLQRHRLKRTSDSKSCLLLRTSIKSTMLDAELVADYRGQPSIHRKAGRLRIFQLGLGPDQESAGARSAVDTRPDQSALLNNGYWIPLIGLGTWKSDKGQVSFAVSAALEAGYRHLDCAAVYENEHEVGAALQQAFDTKLVQRNELFVTSKLW